jgi:hypothetical protein
MGISPATVSVHLANGIAALGDIIYGETAAPEEIP